MVHCIIQDTSTVTVDGNTITGPVSFDADEVTHSGTDYADGVILVSSAGLTQAAKLSRTHVEALPYSYILFFFLGGLIALSWFRK